MMRWIHKLPLRLRSLLRRGKVEQDLRDELQFHVEMLTGENLADGMSRDEARYAAMRELGGIEQIKESCREARRVGLVEDLVRDAGFGLRMMAKSPGVTAVAVCALALGIGANSAVFSLVDAVLLRPLPYRNPGSLVLVSETLPYMGGETEVGMAAGEYLDYRDRNRSFVETAAWEPAGFNLTGAGTPIRVNAAYVTASVFPLLGVSPLLGRTFGPDEEHPGRDAVAVLSYPVWRDHYGGDPGILGRTIKLDERPFVIIGVMPPSFHFPSDGAPFSRRAELWVPEVFAPERVQDRLREFGVGFVGRLRPGVGISQAQADVSGIAEAFMQQYQYPGTIRVAPRVHRFAAYAVEKARPLVLLLVAAVTCVLLIACANVASLLLARGTYRRREMAIRSAMGAARGRLLRQCLVESLVLAVAGAGAGLGVGVLLVQGAHSFGPANVPQLREISLNATALLFTVILSLLTTLLFGFIPAWRISRPAATDCLRESNRVSGSRATNRAHALLVVAEIALAVVLLVGGGVLLQSFVRVLNAPLGFRPEGLFVVRTLFDRARYPDPVRRSVVQREVIGSVSALHGVRSLAAASHLPLSDTRQIGFRLEQSSRDDFHWAENSLVSPGYFRTMGIAISRGREFTEEDRRDTPPVAVVSETLAHRYFPDRDPIGQRFHWGDRTLFTIVGIAGDVRSAALDREPPPMIYTCMFQVESGASERTALLLRVDADRQHDQALFDQVRQRVWALDRDVPVYNFASLEMLISESAAQRRFTTVLVLSFAATALLLAVVGLFGVMSFLAAQRRREIAIRIALGAERTGVRWTVMKRGCALALAGCATGLALLPGFAALVRTALYDTSAYDPITLLLVPSLLLGVSALASYIPACRVTRIDPVAALRCE